MWESVSVQYQTDLTFIPFATAVLPLFGPHLFLSGFDGVSVPGPVNVYLQCGDLSQNIVTPRKKRSAFAQPQPAIQVQDFTLPIGAGGGSAPN